MLQEKTKTFCIIFLILSIIISGKLYPAFAHGAARQLTDAAGRTVSVPDKLAGGIVTVGGSGPLRFLSIFDVFDKIIEIDKGDVTDSKNGRAYSYAYPYDTFKPDRYHPDNKLESQTVEKIGKKKPGLIIVHYSVYHNYRENCDILGGKFPLIVIPSQSTSVLWNEKYELADWYRKTVNLIGTMLNKTERASRHIARVNSIIADIRSFVGKSNKRVYVAGLTWQGSNELNTTFPAYLPLMLVDGNNAHEGKETNRVIMDPEAVTRLSIDYFLIDPSSADKLATPNSQLIMEWLYKRNNDGSPDNDIRLSVTMPMVWDHVNYDCLLCGAYYLAHLLYNTLTIGTVETKINAVFKAFYGKRGEGIFKDMQNFFSSKSRAHKVELPPLKEVKVVHSENLYRIVLK